MKVLITGATGFVGQKLGAALALRGHQINVLSRSLTSRCHFPCEIFEWHPESGKVDLRAFEGVEAVINLAGRSLADQRWTDAVKESILSSRLASTETLWSTLRQNSNLKVKTFINASAVGYYGDAGDTLVHESSPVGEGFLADVCRRWEKSALAGVEGVRKIVIRMGMVLGKNGGALEKMLPVFKLGLGGCLGGGKQWVSWIHIDDLVQLYIFALENENIQGIINAVSPQPVRNYEFTKQLAAALRRPAIISVPSLALKVTLGEMSEVLLSSQRVSSQKVESLGFNFEFRDLKTALKSLT